MLHPFTKENAAQAGQKGGKASGRTRRKWKTFCELMEAALRAEMPGGGSAAENIVAGLISKACSGDPKAVSLILDVVGERPIGAAASSQQDFQVVLFGGAGGGAGGKAIAHSSRGTPPEIANMLAEIKTLGHDPT